MPVPQPHQLVNRITAHDAIVEAARREVSRRHEDEVAKMAEAMKEEAYVRGVNVSRLPEYVRDATARGVHLIQIIKEVRAATGWGLKDAKDFCDVIRSSWKIMEDARRQGW